MTRGKSVDYETIFAYFDHFIKILEVLNIFPFIFEWIFLIFVEVQVSVELTSLLGFGEEELFYIAK